MKITVCGSMTFSKEMVAAKQQLESQGHQVVIPEGSENHATDTEIKNKIIQGETEDAHVKISQDLLRKYYEEIGRSDAVLIFNLDKNGIRNYVGGNSFLEMGFAYVQHKKIYALNPLPEEQTVFYQELLAMQPIILDGDLTRILAQ